MENQNEIMKKYYELGESLTKFQSYIPIIQIDVDSALEMAKTMNEHKKELFLGRQYMNLLSDLEKAGIIKLKDNVDDYCEQCENAEELEKIRNEMFSLIGKRSNRIGSGGDDLWK